MAKPKKPKKAQTAAPTVDETSSREHVISFRIRHTTSTELENMLNDEPVVGVSSTKQLARKIVEDYVAGRLVYKDPRHKMFVVD